MSARKTLDIFTKEAKLIHGDKYDYSKVEYTNAHTKVKIVCPIHGEFEQRPYRHLTGDGCRECSKSVVSKKNSLSVIQFIEKAKIKHGDKYDYSKIEYINNKTKVKIICPIHGEFMQIPDSHLKGSGCDKCGRINASLNKRKSLSDFIKDAKIIHGEKYNYDLVNYITTNDYIDIICHKHGVFKQKAYKHLQNQGCPVCNESKMEKKIRQFLINNGINFTPQYGKKNGINWLGNQTLDFYLNDFNVAIECQGEQHFKPVDFSNKGFYSAQIEFQKILKRDSEKFNKCKKNNIKIFYYNDDLNLKNTIYFGEIYNDEIEMLENIKKNYGK
jgi:hypothetical protein